MKKFETNKYCEITNFRYHDLIFGGLNFNGKTLELSLHDKESCISKIIFDDVKFLQIDELVPNGIILSCYSFRLGELPEHLTGFININTLKNFVNDTDIKVLYIDGTYGFNFIIAYSNAFILS